MTLINFLEQTILTNKTIASCVNYPIFRWKDGVVSETIDSVAEEAPIALLYNGASYAVMLALPQDLEEFVLGFSITEKIIEYADELLSTQILYHEEGIEIRLEIPDIRARVLPKQERRIAGRSGCGLCGVNSLEQAIRVLSPVKAGPKISAKILHKASAALWDEQKLHKLTGGVHAAAWANTNGDLLWVMEDVGRHNALDKLIGRLIIEKTDIQQGFLLMSSRASYELVQKAASVGISILAAVSAPTGLAIRLAKEAQITLLAFVRKDSHVVYSLADRIID